MTVQLNVAQTNASRNDSKCGFQGLGWLKLHFTFFLSAKYVFARFSWSDNRSILSPFMADIQLQQEHITYRSPVCRDQTEGTIPHFNHSDDQALLAYFEPFRTNIRPTLIALSPQVPRWPSEGTAPLLGKVRFQNRIHFPVLKEQIRPDKSARKLVKLWAASNGSDLPSMQLLSK